MIFREFLPRRPSADLAADRERMITHDLRGRGIRDERVLSAMDAVPRELFVPPDLRHEAYTDRALPIGHGQTISQPYIVALMVEALELRGRETVLDVGAGSGYATAVLAHLTNWVVGIERIPELAAAARERLKALGLDHCDILVGDGARGSPADAPFDAILVSAAAPELPLALADQLADGGRIVLPLGPEMATQILTVWTRRGRELEANTLCPCRFVPLIPGGSDIQPPAPGTRGEVP